ncbi:MAG: SpoIVB peptidase [Clostridiales bacterium]|nr:SpoIVB peptidase [Clostridiales bacterium]
MRDEYECQKNADPVRKKYRIFLTVLLLITIIGIIAFSYYKVNSLIPERIRILAGKEHEFDLSVPMEADVYADNISVTQRNASNIPAGSLNIDLSKPFSLHSNETGSYRVVVKLFGWLAVKEIKLDVIDTQEVIPCGSTIGITLNTDGVLVLGTAKVSAKDGLNYEPSIGKLKTGDYIVEANGTTIQSKEQLIDIIQQSNGNNVDLKVNRNEEFINVVVCPVETAEGEYKIGSWIRDDTQGIGTLTFVTTTGQFGALGHGITDVDTGLLMSVGDGNIYDAEIINIVKGKSGTPGELSGIIHESEKSKLGSISENTVQGIFGNISTRANVIRNISNDIYKKPIPIALKQDIKVGDATILCNVDGTVQEYKIKITEIDFGNSQSKGLVIKITDERLTSLTGGIVQGMSGSPIIQDNKLVGAVTHVFIRDATMGYGTFIENMLQILQ